MPRSAVFGAARRRAGRAPARLRIGRLALALTGPRVGAGAAAAPQALREFDPRDRAAIAPAVREVLAAHAAAPAAAPIEVRLAGGCCRLMLLPWNRQLTSPERWRNFARARFEEKFGLSSEDWDLCLAQDLPGHDRLAVAWPAGLRAVLADCAQVRSVRVELLEQLGVVLARRPRFSGCLAEIEGDAAVLLLLLQGRVRRIRACHFEQPGELVSALRAEWAALAGASEPATGALALALCTPFPQRDGARAGAFAARSAELGFRLAEPQTEQA